MKPCEMCEFGNCVWPDCERAEALQFYEAKEAYSPWIMTAVWGCLMAITVAFWSIFLAWVF